MQPHLAIGGPILAVGNPFIILSAYLIPVVILVVFGIWGFRLGARHPGGSGGGGQKRPKPTPPPTGGGRSHDERVLESLDVGSLLEQVGPQEQAQERERELV